MSYAAQLKQEHIARRAKFFPPPVRVRVAERAALKPKPVIVESHLPPLNPVSPILRAVCARYGVTGDELRSRSRKVRLTRIRQVAMYLCWRHTDCGVTQIGRHFNRDHSTVAHAIRKIEQMIALHGDVDTLSAAISQRNPQNLSAYGENLELTETAFNNSVMGAE